jgi:hypothetical protein
MDEQLENDLRDHISDLEDAVNILGQLRGEIEDVLRDVQATKEALKTIEEDLDNRYDIAYNEAVEDEDSTDLDDIDFLMGLLEEAKELVESCEKE